MSAARAGESPDRLQLATILALYGAFLASRDEDEKADRILEEALAILHASVGEDDSRTRRAAELLANLSRSDRPQ